MIEATVDPKEVVGFLGQLKSEFPWACSVAINRTVELGLQATRESMQRSMTIRVPAFLPPQQLPTAWRATKDKLQAELRVGYGETPQSIGTRAANIFSKFEEGGIKQPSGSVYIPTKALRPNKADLVPRALYPRNLIGDFDSSGNLVGFKRGKARGTKMGRGARSIYSYFVLDPATQAGVSGRSWGIWERTGPGRGDIRMVWAFRRSVPIPASLRFYETGLSVVDAVFDSEFSKAWDFQMSAPGSR